MRHLKGGRGTARSCALNRGPKARITAVRDGCLPPTISGAAVKVYSERPVPR